MIVRVRILVCVCVFLDRPSSCSKTVEYASNAAVELWLSALSSHWRLLACSATVAVLSQSSGIERPFFCHAAGSHGLHKDHATPPHGKKMITCKGRNCALYMLSYKQQCHGRE